SAGAGGRYRAQAELPSECSHDLGQGAGVGAKPFEPGGRDAAGGRPRGVPARRAPGDERGGGERPALRQGGGAQGSSRASKGSSR
ncbi:unnamed protein product, partial [Effrenium voratum]